MKNVFMAVINRGNYDLNGLLRRIDEYHISGALSDAERAELTAAARGEAAPGLDAAGEIQRLWAEVRALTARVAALEGSGNDGSEAGTVPEYAQPTGGHDAYYAGDRVRFEGQVYECTAPAGMACVWSPAVMPDHWTIIPEAGPAPDAA